MAAMDIPVSAVAPGHLWLPSPCGNVQGYTQGSGTLWGSGETNPSNLIRIIPA